MKTYGWITRSRTTIEVKQRWTRSVYCQTPNISKFIWKPNLHLHYGVLSKKILTQVQNSRDPIKIEVIKSGHCSTRWTNLSSHFARYSTDKSVLIINHMSMFTLEFTQFGISSVQESFVDAGVAAGELERTYFCKTVNHLSTCMLIDRQNWMFRDICLVDLVMLEIFQHSNVISMQTHKSKEWLPAFVFGFSFFFFFLADSLQVAYKQIV